MPIHPGRRPGAHCPKPAVGAFTLVELLTVILILALLATLILATASRPIALARALVCRQHLRDWGLATRLYVEDHDDLLPPEGFPNPTERHTNQGWYIQLPRQIQAPRYHDQPWRTNPAAALGNSPWHCPVNRRRSNGNNLFQIWFFCKPFTLQALVSNGSPCTRYSPRTTHCNTTRSAFLRENPP